MLSHLAGAIGEASLLAYCLVALAGVVTSLGPCNLAMVPVVVAFVGGATDVTRGRAAVMSALFALGSAVTFTVLGVLAALIGGMFGAAHGVLYLIVAAVCISVGLAMVGAIRLPLPSISTLSIVKSVRKGLLGAFLLGLVLGLAGSQCGTPAMVAILSVALAKGKVAYGASLLFAYGAGRGVPIVIAGASAGALSRSRALARWSQALERAAGAVMMLAGLYFVWAA